MASHSGYNTRQRELLLSYFESVPGVHVTAADICGHFRSIGVRIGQATVYRRLESLVQEGVIRKYTIGPGSPACFEYTGTDDHAESGTCFHCKCEKCGRLIHLSCEELNAISAHLMTEHSFKPDPVRTVIYGLCEQCMSE